jgi:hypothetical protein
MAIPLWIIAIRDPAHAYMVRRSGNPRGRPHLRRHRADRAYGGYAPLGAPMPQPTPDQLQQLWLRADAAHRVFLARVRDMESRHGELLRRTVEELTRAGTATLRTSAGDIQARMVRFRKDAVVLEVDFPGGWSQSRASLSTVGEASVHALTSALAQIRPEAEPLS